MIVDVVARSSGSAGSRRDEGEQEIPNPGPYLRRPPAHLVLHSFRHRGRVWRTQDAFTLASVLLGTLMAWLRLATGSIWPAVVAHAAASGVASQIMGAFDSASDPAGATFSTSLAGWPGWGVMAVAVAVLVVTGRFSAARLTPPVRAAARPS